MRHVALKKSLTGLALVLLQASSACAQQPAYAPPPQRVITPGFIFGEIASAVGLTPTETPPDFVVKGRPDPSTLDYVQLKPPPRDFHSLSADPGARLLKESDAISELERERARTHNRAAEMTGAPKIPVPVAAKAAQEADAERQNWPPKWSDTE